MEYEFKNIESLIVTAIQSSESTKKSLPEQFATVRKSVTYEIAVRKHTFLHQAWALEKGFQRTNYVQYHQHCLIKFIDVLFTISSNEAKNGKSNLASEVFFFYNQLEDILDLIQDEFETEFDDGAKIPESKKEVVLKSLEREYSQIKSFLDDEDLDSGLAIIAKQFIQNAIDKKTCKLTYGRINYLENLIQEISEITEQKHPRDMTDELRSCLISINFNKSDFFRYCTQAIQMDVSRIEFETDQAERLSHHLKNINQIQSRQGLFYNHRLASIKEQLSDWLKEEIQFIDRKCKLSTVSKDKDDDFTKRDFKLEFDMSVSQFAFFTKTLVESGVIQNKNVSELIRFLSKFVKTKRSGSISHESFRIKYYNVEESTKDAVKNTFHTAIGYINRN